MDKTGEATENGGHGIMDANIGAGAASMHAGMMHPVAVAAATQYEMFQLDYLRIKSWFIDTKRRYGPRGSLIVSRRHLLKTRGLLDKFCTLGS